MPFKVANSSFIFERRLRSITLCAVFLATFFFAAVVAGGFVCFAAAPLSLFMAADAFFAGVFFPVA